MKTRKKIIHFIKKNKNKNIYRSACREVIIAKFQIIMKEYTIAIDLLIIIIIVTLKKVLVIVKAITLFIIKIMIMKKIILLIMIKII